MSGGIDVRLRGMTSPSRSGRDVSLRGSNVRYCSPTADWLCTCASRSEGILYFEFSDNVASTPESVSCTDSTRPTSVPR